LPSLPCGKSSPISLPVSLTYLHVKLADGERWTYQPSAEHEIAWLALNNGKLDVSGIVLERELAVFEDGVRSIEVVAQGAAELVIGSAAKHPYPLVTGHYSVHTSRDALIQGEANIAALERSPVVAALRARRYAAPLIFVVGVDVTALARASRC